jgi:uncharacterized beta-barrel protein YwiB (DUF1934 family)
MEETQNAPVKVGNPKMATWKKVLLGIGIFIVGVIALAMWATSGIVKVAEDQLALIKAGDISGAYQMTSGMFQQATSLDVFTDFVNSYTVLSQNAKVSFSERSVENDTGYLFGTITAQDGTAMKIEYQLIKENDKWAIVGINLTP